MAGQRICVYCGSKPGTHAAYMQAARDLGEILVSRRIGLVYGGARVGTMGALADAVVRAGGEAIGVIPRGLVNLEVAHENLTELHVVETLHERKSHMLELCQGVITLPGGHGSHDELFEALTWLQLGIHDKPVGLLNVRRYYDGLLSHLQHASAEGFLDPAHLEMLLVADQPGDLLDAMAASLPPDRPPWRGGA